LEIAVAVYVHARIDRFAEETLNSLPSHEPNEKALKQ